MHQLQLTQMGIFQLQQLAKAVRSHTGVRHHLSDPKSVITLLRFSSTSSNPDIFGPFSRFTSQLTEEERKYLQSRGLLLPPVILEKVESLNSQKVG